MPFPYNRTISVHRLKTVAGAADAAIGNVGYSGMERPSSSAGGEGVLATGLACSIQEGAVGRRKDGTLPADIVYAPTWNVYFPAGSVTKGLIRDRDVLIDDEGYRYEVGQAGWDVLGYRLTCIRLEA